MAAASPRPIADLKAIPPLVGILCDIDDTLTHEGRLVSGVLGALDRLQSHGLRVIPVTGRPGGWVDHIARMWPVDGVVGENGGLWYWMDDGRLNRGFEQHASVRAHNRTQLNQLAQHILQTVPGCALASDQPYRELDLAIDFCEDVPHIGDDGIDSIVRCFDAAGATCKVSSIHVNGWFGSFDKLAGIRRFHRERWGTEIDLERWAFFGDSANDEPMFKAFPLSVGVANVRDFLPRMETGPRWITDGEGGHGFLEAVELLLSRLSAP